MPGRAARTRRSSAHHRRTVAASWAPRELAEQGAVAAAVPAGAVRFRAAARTPDLHARPAYRPAPYPGLDQFVQKPVRPLAPPDGPHRRSTNSSNPPIAARVSRHLHSVLLSDPTKKRPPPWTWGVGRRPALVGASVCRRSCLKTCAVKARRSHGRGGCAASRIQIRPCRQAVLFRS